MNNIHPIKDRVLVRRTEVKEKTEGGILIPSTAQKLPLEGYVVGVGPGVRDVNEMDKVLFPRYAGTEINISKDTVLMLSEDDLLAVIE